VEFVVVVVFTSQCPVVAFNQDPIERFLLSVN